MRLKGVMSAADRDDLAEAPPAVASLCVVVVSRPPPVALGECAIGGLLLLFDLDACKQTWLYIIYIVHVHSMPTYRTPQRTGYAARMWLAMLTALTWRQRRWYIRDWWWYVRGYWLVHR